MTILRQVAPEVHVLIPYSRDKSGKLTSPLYDTPLYREELHSWFDKLGLTYVWTAVALDNINEVVTVMQRRNQERQIVVLNLCDGTENNLVPGKSVIRALKDANLPFSGASEAFYINTTSKIATKRLLEVEGVSHPAWLQILDPGLDLARAAETIGFPLIVKPDVSAGSFGIHIDSVCYSISAAVTAVERLRASSELIGEAVFAEAFVDGREFTCFLVEDEQAPLGLWVLTPVERVFDPSLPLHERFLAYERYWGLMDNGDQWTDETPFYHYALAPGELVDELTSTARRAMRAVAGRSYARVDMRQDRRTGTVFVLEVNSQCGLSGTDEATVGSNLQLVGIPIWKIIERILAHALQYPAD